MTSRSPIRRSCRCCSSLRWPGSRSRSPCPVTAATSPSAGTTATSSVRWPGSGCNASRRGCGRSRRGPSSPSGRSTSTVSAGGRVPFTPSSASGTSATRRTSLPMSWGCPVSTRCTSAWCHSGTIPQRSSEPMASPPPRPTTHRPRH